MLKGKKILLVEDSRTIRLQIRMMLEQEGADLVETGSEWGMLSKIEEFGKVANLIIISLVLNNENGLDLIGKLKKNIRYKDIPIVIITEKADIDTVKKAKQLGVNSYLKKPVKKADLINRISALLQVTNFNY